MNEEDNTRLPQADPLLESDPVPPGVHDHGQFEYGTAAGNDYPAHEQTYRTFVTLVRNALGAIVVILILMGFFLA